MRDAQTYLEGIVVPTIEDFEKEPASVRRAFLACVALFHTIDYLAAEGRSSNRQNLRSQLRKESADFLIVDRVAHAFKHMKSGHERSDINRPLHAWEIFSRPPAFAGVMVAGLSYVGDLTGGVEIWNENGTDLLGVV